MINIFQRNGASSFRIIVAQPSCPQLSSPAQGAMHCTSATSGDSVEQPVHSKSDSAEQPAFKLPSRTSAEQVPIIEVAFKNGLWWSIPEAASRDLYEELEQGLDAGYIWDWREPMTESWVNECEATNISRYVIYYMQKCQHNIDSHSIRSMRVAWVRPADVTPRWTGEKAANL